MSIQIVGVSKTYRMGAIEVTALAGVSLAIADGQLVAIMGPSAGAGGARGGWSRRPSAAASEP